MSRYGSGLGISPISENYHDREHETVISKPSWLDQYAQAMENLEKSSVKSRQEDQSLYDQISAIIGNKSKFSTVEECVEDLKHRSGLTAFLAAKQASDNSETFQKSPVLKNFIDNYIDAHPGSSVESVIQAALKIPQIVEVLPLPDDVPDDVKQYINHKLGEVDLGNTNNEDAHLGKVDLQIDNQITQDNAPLNSLIPKGQF
jgi:hypothetical protein